MQVHPAAELFPLIEGKEFDDLVQSIRDHGLIHPGVRDETGVLLDGRNRLRACEQAGVTFRTTTYMGSNPTDYIVASNRDRRHLTREQLAFIALGLEPIYAAEAAKRQRAGRSPGHPGKVGG